MSSKVYKEEEIEWSPQSLQKDKDFVTFAAVFNYLTFNNNFNQC